MKTNKKITYFVKYRRSDGSMNTKIMESFDQERVLITEVRFYDKMATEVIKCRRYNMDKEEMDKEDTIW